MFADTKQSIIFQQITVDIINNGLGFLIKEVITTF